MGPAQPPKVPGPAWLAALAATLAAAQALSAICAQAAPSDWWPPRPAQPLPDAQAAQQAYEDAKDETGKDAPASSVLPPRQHVYELAIAHAQCSPLPAARNYVCQVDFVRRAQPQGRLYFDVITLAERQGRWVLLSGLCKGRVPPR